MTRIGVFLPNWVGDVVMATPTLRALRRRHEGRSELIGIMRPYLSDVLAGTPWLDEQIFYDPRSWNRELGAMRLIRELRRRRLDAIVLLTNSMRTALLARLCGAAARVGYDRGGRGWLLTHRLEPLRDGRAFRPAPVLDSYLELAYTLGCPPEPRQVELATLPADERAADGVWSKFRFAGGRSVVTLNSSGAFGAAKLWPKGYFSALARRIALEQKRGVLVLCGPGERELAREIVRDAGHPRVQCLADEELGIGLSKACVKRSGLLVTTDSGPRHFAAAFGVPAITLFGPTHMAWSENYHSLATNLQLELECAPCQQRVCPLRHHRCMQDLSIDEVYRAVKHSLAASRELASAPTAAA